MIKSADLQTMCPNCKGIGFIQDWQWVQWWAENNFPPPDGHPILDIVEEIPCYACDEVGYVPTELGYTLLEFLNRFRGRK